MNESFPPSRKELLQKLIERILSDSHDSGLSSLELFVGQLPPDIAFTPPLPSNCQLLGSRRHNSDLVEELFDTTLTPTQIIRFYRERLEEADWYEHEHVHEQRERGFITTANQRLGAYVHFCHGPQGPSLNLFALKRHEELTEVRMFLHTSQDDSPCKPDPELDPRLMSTELAHNLFPRLMPPDGAQHVEAESQSTRYSATTTSLVETEQDIPLLTLAAHYASQLEEAGWIRTSEAHSNQFAWQTWYVRDEGKERTLQGLFLCIKIPDTSNRFYVHAHINAA